MATDDRIKNKASFLKDNLRVDLLLFELLEDPCAVLRKSEYQEIDAVFKSRGCIEANRTLLGFLLVGKSSRQIDRFVKIVGKYQQDVGHELDPLLVAKPNPATFVAEKGKNLRPSTHKPTCRLRI